MLRVRKIAPRKLAKNGKDLSMTTGPPRETCTLSTANRGRNANYVGQGTRPAPGKKRAGVGINVGTRTAMLVSEERPVTRACATYPTLLAWEGSITTVETRNLERIAAKLLTYHMKEVIPVQTET